MVIVSTAFLWTRVENFRVALSAADHMLVERLQRGKVRREVHVIARINHGDVLVSTRRRHLRGDRIVLPNRCNLLEYADGSFGPDDASGSDLLSDHATTLRRLGDEFGGKRIVVRRDSR